MQNAMTKTRTAYIIRPNAYPGHFDVFYSREDGTHGFTATVSGGLRAAVASARGFMADGDKLFARKSLYRGNNAGAWHRLAAA